MLRQMRPVPIVCSIALGLAGCSSHAPTVASAPSQALASPSGKGVFKVGQPYQVNGIWYYPAEDFNYNETGIASWYGPDFDQKYTANGEIFDQNLVTAAHKTLPLPSIVRVTNLENGRSIELRVNDRGPYVGNRIIDLSRRAAQLLGYEQAGTAKVRVQILVPETIQAQSLAKLNGSEGAPTIEHLPPAPREVVLAQALPPPSAPQPRPIPPPPPPHAPEKASIPIPAEKPVPPGPTLSEAVTVVPVRPSHIFIQAGAFASTANAAKMKAMLASVGPATVTPIKVSGMAMYRVRLGPVATVDQADAMLAKAVGAGAGGAKIVVE